MVNPSINLLIGKKKMQPRCLQYRIKDKPGIYQEATIYTGEGRKKKMLLFKLRKIQQPSKGVA